MQRSESQSMYNALPGAYIGFSSNAKDGKRGKYIDKKVLKISYWNTVDVRKEDIYYPKIVSQIFPDLCDFKSETNSKIQVDSKLAQLMHKEYRNRVNFVEVNKKIEEKQIIGHIDPKMFYCPECGKIKILKDDNDIENMVCRCKGKTTIMNQYNRIWVCSCGESYSINEYQVDVEKDRYFASAPNGIIKENGKQETIKAPHCKCGNICTLENATDPKAFYPRIITSIKLTEDSEAELCSNDKGRKLIIDRQIGKISEEEFKNGAKELNQKAQLDNFNIGIEPNIDFLNKLSMENKAENIDSIIDEESVYKLLEYNTIKRKILKKKEDAINNSIKFGDVFDESEINNVLKKLKIKDISSVSDIEIINTAYGYTRKYQSPDETKTDKEPLVLRAFTKNGSNNPTFYNIRTKTEGIIIDIDKKAIYEYVKEVFSQKQFRFKDLSEKEIESWFLDKTKISPRLIKKFEPIDTDNDNATNLYTKCVYNILHTISHMFINSISKFCGIDKSSLSEMIFINTGSILIYSQTNQGAVLGALTSTFEKKLFALLNSVYNDNKVCTFDPLCMNTSEGSCCACTYLNEVACEHFNNDLTRRILYGYGDVDSLEYIKNFWEEI